MADQDMTTYFIRNFVLKYLVTFLNNGIILKKATLPSYLS